MSTSWEVYTSHSVRPVRVEWEISPLKKQPIVMHDPVAEFYEHMERVKSKHQSDHLGAVGDA